MPNIIVRDYVTTMKRLHNKYDERLSSLMFMNDYSINEQKCNNYIFSLHYDCNIYEIMFYSHKI